jgi:hypothetical protein
VTLSSCLVPLLRFERRRPSGHRPSTCRVCQFHHRGITLLAKYTSCSHQKSNCRKRIKYFSLPAISNLPGSFYWHTSCFLNSNSCIFLTLCYCAICSLCGRVSQIFLNNNRITTGCVANCRISIHAKLTASVGMSIAS